MPDKDTQKLSSRNYWSWQHVIKLALAGQGVYDLVTGDGLQVEDPTKVKVV